MCSALGDTIIALVAGDIMSVLGDIINALGTGGYHECIGGISSVHWERGTCIGGISSLHRAFEGFHDSCGGYHQSIGVFQNNALGGGYVLGDIISA